MAPLSGEWLEALKGEFHQPYYAKLYKTVMQEYQTHKIFPPADDMFNAFHFTPLSQVKVVILGQDPYHNDGQAHGLCFSVKRDVEIPPSLVNIYQELHDDLGCYIPDNGYLEKWARQGVLMLNTVLTVRAHQANSHRGIGWEQFTDAAIGILNEQDRPIVFLLWGRPAQMKLQKCPEDFSWISDLCGNRRWNRSTGVFIWGKIYYSEQSAECSTGIADLITNDFPFWNPGCIQRIFSGIP